MFSNGEAQGSIPCSCVETSLRKSQSQDKLLYKRAKWLKCKRNDDQNTFRLLFLWWGCGVCYLSLNLKRNQLHYFNSHFKPDDSLHMVWELQTKKRNPDHRWPLWWALTLSHRENCLSGARTSGPRLHTWKLNLKLNRVLLLPLATGMTLPPQKRDNTAP